MISQDDLNLIRRDMWFSSPEDVAPFLQKLFREHSACPEELVSAALWQARRNLVIGSPNRERLRAEVARLLCLSLAQARRSSTAPAVRRRNQVAA